MPVVVNLILGRKKEEPVLGDVGELDLAAGDRVIIDIDQAQEVAVVAGRERMLEKSKEPVYRILKKFAAEEAQRMEDNKKKAAEAVKAVLERIKSHELQMKLTCIEYSFDRSKLFVYYTSETRVDFRQLIKDLGHLLKTRIQMVQIGVRDEAKMLGGIGPCGRVLCCSSFLRNFAMVGIDTAKLQDPLMNVSKMSGCCGRLMCCLSFESKFYEEQARKMPRPGARVHTPEGQATVVAVNLLTEEMTVEFHDKQVKKFRSNQITPPNPEKNRS
jgi:cell fate regulator YaaT (PSP1 superfamily)